MTFELTKEQRWEIFNNLPVNLQDAIFSEDTASAIWSICELHNINESSVIGSIVGKVLMGLLPPDKIPEVLQKRILSMNASLANTVAIEIQHYILDPLMDDLMTLYTPEKLEKLDNKEETPQPQTESRDVYRETINE